MGCVWAAFVFVGVICCTLFGFMPFAGFVGRFPTELPPEVFPMLLILVEELFRAGLRFAAELLPVKVVDNIDGVGTGGCGVFVFCIWPCC